MEQKLASLLDHLAGIIPWRPWSETTRQPTSLLLGARLREKAMEVALPQQLLIQKGNGHGHQAWATCRK